MSSKEMVLTDRIEAIKEELASRESESKDEGENDPFVEKDEEVTKEVKDEIGQLRNSL